MNLAEIQKSVHAWSIVQFPNNTPLEPIEGLIEEIGELAHGRLKRRQGIRHTPEQCIAMERDAIGDAGVYLCDFASRVGHLLAIDDIDTLVRRCRPGQSDAMAFAILARKAGDLAYLFHDVRDGDIGVAFDWRAMASEVAARLAIYSHLRGWDFLDILNETWAKVSRRDWRADPMAANLEAS